MSDFTSFVPKASIPTIKKWLDQLDVRIYISKSRVTKLGDFKVINNEYAISINKDLNKYSFLITLTHELAHAFVYDKYKNSVKPHGTEWKSMFKSMMLNFMNLDCFTDNILKVLSEHMLKIKASTYSDLNLALCLRKYDCHRKDVLQDLEENQFFRIKNNRIFCKKRKLRKRYKCIEKNTGKTYLLHPLIEVDLIKSL